MSVTAMTRIAAVASATVAAVSVCLGTASAAAAAEPAQVRVAEQGPAAADPGPSTQWVPLGTTLFSDRAVKNDVTPVRWDR
ncbi:hypothetical protein F0344_00640 [Streptomyces finlayi]|uniref:Uncharacterized protein n=1 Tax=Streptomyces finlayi TaxID=67296 RepID=A0A7G7BDB3_9ACTN|nr:hypothetical protein [Streptomyces finlayi]QNE73328.1 hypothetical protein F0344_00640 [Streptomyces finlayi]